MPLMLWFASAARDDAALFASLAVSWATFATWPAACPTFCRSSPDSLGASVRVAPELGWGLVSVGFFMEASASPRQRQAPSNVPISLGAPRQFARAPAAASNLYAGGKS